MVGRKSSKDVMGKFIPAAEEEIWVKMVKMERG